MGGNTLIMHGTNTCYKCLSFDKLSKVLDKCVGHEFTHIQSSDTIIHGVLVSYELSGIASQEIHMAKFRYSDGRNSIIRMLMDDSTFSIVDLETCTYLRFDRYDEVLILPKGVLNGINV